MYNFEAFIKQYENKFNNCKYPYFANKCKEIVRKLFFKSEISEEEKDMLKNRLGISAEEWQKLIKEYNREEEAIFTQECFLDPDNMPYAP